MIYRTLNEHYREKFGCKVYKLSIDAGFTCPTGTVLLEPGAVFSAPITAAANLPKAAPPSPSS